MMVSLRTAATAAALLLGSASAFAPQSAVPARRSGPSLSMLVDPANTQHAADLLSSLPSLSVADATAVDFSGAATSFTPSYSKASYYTTLALYVMSFPGLWSQVKRSTKAKVKRKTFVSDGEAAPDGKDLRQQAGEIMAYMKANNYEVLEAGETITFRGLVQRSVSQACFLMFCTGLGMASLALVLQIQFQDLSELVPVRMNE